jgi:hypothetical protein
MKSLSTAKFVAVAALAVAGFGAVSAAHARTDVVLSIGLPVYSQPAPVYYQPAPVYYEPAPAYVQPRQSYVAPRTVYVQSAPAYNWERRHHGHRQWDRFGPNGDLDRDGIRNQYDHDRDGDGVRNRYDRTPDGGYRY